MDYNHYTEEDEEISLVEVFKYIARHWKTILIFCLVACVAGCAYGYTKIVPATSTNLKAYIESLDESKLNLATIERYQLYQKLLLSQKEYNDSSLAMSIDQNKTYIATLSYAITGKTDEINLLTADCKAILDRNGGWEKLNNVIGGTEYNSAYIKEIVEISVRAMNTFSDKDDSKNNKTICLDFSVYCAKEDDAIALSSVFAAMVNEEYPSAKQIANSISCGHSDKIAKLQSTAASNFNSYSNTLSSIKKNLSDNDLKYIDYLNGENYEIRTEGNGFSFKYPLIGFALGLFVACMYLGFKYVMDGSVRSTDDVTDLMRLRLIAVYPDNDFDYVVSSIRSNVDGKLLLCSENGDEAVKTFADKIGEQDNIEISGDLSASTKAVEKANAVDNIAFVAKLWDTKRANIARQCAIAQSMGKNIAGVIIVK